MIRKLWKRTLCLLFALCLIAPSSLPSTFAANASSSQPNLLPNPGFEKPPEEGRPIPGWHIHSALDDGNEAEVIDHISSEGSNSLLIKDVSSSKAVIVYSDPIEIKEGQSFQLTYQAANVSGTISAAVRQYQRETDHAVNEQISPQSSVRMSSAAEWTQYQVDGDRNPGANYIRVMIYTVSTSLGEAIVDDFRLTITDNSGGSIPYEEVNLGSLVHNLVFNRDGYYTDPSGKTVAYVIQAGDPNILLVIDVETGDVIHSIPVIDTVDGVEYKGEYLRGFTIQPDGTVYMGGTPSQLFKYVPGEDRVHYLSKLPGSATFDLKNGPPGILIGGTYNRNEAFEYNIQTGELTNLRRVTSDEMYVYSVAYDEENNDYYFGIGSHAHVIRYDRDTGEKTEIPIPERFSNAQFVWDMNVRQGKLFLRFSPGASLALDLESGQFEETDAIITSRLVSPVSPEGDRVYFSDASQLGYYDFNTKQYVFLPVELESAANMIGFAQLSDPEYPGYTLIAMMDGWMLHYNLENGNQRTLRIPVEGEASTLQTVAKALDGRMHTSGYISGGNAMYDPVTGQVEEYSKPTIGKDQVVPGSQTDRIFSYKDKIYYATYGSARIYEYDQSLPWDRLDPVNPNPKLLFSVSDYDQDRPLAGIVVQEAGKYVLGTVPDYGMLGGALVIYDLETNEREVYRNVIDQQSVTAVTYKDGLIYGGSNIWGGLGIQATETEAKLFIWDMEKKEKVFETVPIAGKRGITDLIVGPDGMIWGNAEGDLFIFDPETRQVVHRQNLTSRTYGSAVWRDAQFQTGSDGNVYGVQMNQFFVIDAETKKKTVIRNNGNRNWLGQDDFGRFYLTEETELIQITIPELLLRPIGAQLDVSATTLSPDETADFTITGLIDKGRTIQKLERRSPQYFSSNPSVVSFEGDKLVAKNTGTAEVWAQVSIDGVSFETNHVAMTVTASQETVTLETLENELSVFIQAGDLDNAMASQLTNALRQVNHFLAQGKSAQALDLLERFQSHLLNPALSDKITPQAKESLAADVEWLIQSMQSNG